MNNNNAKGDKTSMAPGMITGFLAGLAAGAVMGVLFAPKKGSETRQDLKNKAMAARDKAKQRMAKRKENAKTAIQQAANQAPR